jgi:PAS domain S-box-containing protein
MTVSTILSFFKNLFIPANVTREDGLMYWRELILHAMLGTGVILGLVAIIPVVFLAISEKLWGLLIFDLLMYMTTVIIAVFRNWSYELRAATILLVFYCVGIWVTVHVGPLSGGPAWMFAGAVFTGLLLGLRAAFVSVLVNGVSLGIIGWMIFNGHLAADFPFFSSAARAIAAGANFLVLNAGAAISVSVLVRGLQESAEKEKSANEIIKREQADLLKARENLRQEIEIRKEAEEALRVERDTLDRITRSIGAGLAVISRDYRTLWANAVLKKMFGDLEGKPCFEVYNQRSDICVGCGVREVFEEGKEEAVHEQMGRDSQGNLVWSQIIATPIRDVKGNVTSALELVVPITERKRAEEERRLLEKQLEKARKMEAIATLAGGIAHQFNNLLSAISGNIELLRLDATENKHYHRYFAPMENSIDRMAHLTGQLLAYARGGKYQVGRIPLSDFVRDTLPIIQHSLKPNIQVETSFPEKITSVDIDITQMQTVLSGILSNASEAIDESGRVLITCSDTTVTRDQASAEPGLIPGKYGLLTVMDNGKGMDEETRNRIFEPFYSTKFQGRGLGMASVYGIVKNHDGWISVDSTVGVGTTVKIYLPAVDDGSSRSITTLPQRGVSAGTILVVEDEEMVLDVTRSMLDKLGYNVLAAGNGAEALRQAENFDGNIDLVLLDIMLPDMGGRDVCAGLLESRPNISIIVCSGYSLNGPAQEILNQGARGFLQKPYTMASLSEKLAAVMQQTHNTT